MSPRMSAIGTKRTSAVALHMSAFDPKRTFVVQLIGVPCRHLPRTGVHHYPIWSLILCQLCSKSSRDFIMLLFSQFARLTVHFTSRSDCKLKSNSIVQVFAYEYLSINLLKLDVLVASDFKLLCHNSGISHRERTRTTCPRILPGRWQKAQHDIFG